MSRLIINGYAIVSADDRIANADGRMPESLVCEADWAYFQAELDRCDLIVLGRASHEAAPNLRRRRRLVISRQAEGGFERRSDALFWNPARLPWGGIEAQLLPSGGRIGVPGGQVAFDLFLRLGFSEFHLSRAPGARLPAGRGLFSAVERGESADRLLRRAGLTPGEERLMDAASGVTLSVYRR